MFKATTPKEALMALTIGVMLTLPAEAALVLIEDDFSSGSVTNNSRFRLNQQGLGWHKNANSEWVIGAGMLMNSGTTTGVPAEGAVGQLVSVSEFGPVVTVSFDYEVGAGSTLFFHLTGLTANAAPAAGEIIANTGAPNGNIQNQWEATFADISILTGNDPGNATADAISFAGATSGTFTMNFDLRDYTWPGTEAGVSGALTSTTDFDFIHAAFGVNETNSGLAGGVAIKNFLVTVPEPNSLPTISFLIVGLLAFFRRSRAL